MIAILFKLLIANVIIGSLSGTYLALVYSKFTKQSKPTTIYFAVILSILFTALSFSLTYSVITMVGV